jgi:uncharacterized protein (TIGR00661 family)
LKILYAIQATGNGHLTRAVEIIPCLRKRAETDVLISGLHAEFEMPFEVTYRRKGYGFFFGKSGGIDATKTFRKNCVVTFMNEVRKIPLHQYDMIITDFEPITAWASFFRGKYCVGIGNQYTLNLKDFKAPEGRFPLSKFLLRNYTPVDKTYPIFYKETGQGVSLPIIRTEIRQMEPRRQNYYLVYLSAYSNSRIRSFLENYKGIKFKVFCKHYEIGFDTNDIKFYPVDNVNFLDALEKCNGVLTHAGFGLTSEAMFLGKKMCVLPMKDQYEQICNADFLKNEMGIHVLRSLSKDALIMEDWLGNGKPVQVYFPNETQKLVDRMLTDYLIYESLFLSPSNDEIITALG